MTTLLAYTSGNKFHDDTTIFSDLLPIGLCSIYSVLRSQGRNVTLANLSAMDRRRLTDFLKLTKPDILGLSLWTHNRHSTIEVARLAKKMLPGCKVIVGGGHATHQAEILLSRHPEIDLVVCGEAEETLPELLDAIQDGTPLDAVAGIVMRDTKETILATAKRARIKKLDSLPYPSLFLHEATGVDLETQLQFVSTSRGCPSACIFCSSPDFWGRQVVARTPESVMAEFMFLRDRFGVIYLSLRDDTFTLDRERILKLCRLLVENRINIFWNCQTRVESVDDELLLWMKRAGCECIQLGVESGSSKTLAYLGKRIVPEQVLQSAASVHRFGLNLSVYIIVGIPDESEADRKDTRELLNQIKPHDIQIAPLAFYPGTSLFASYLKRGVLKVDYFEKNPSEALLVESEAAFEKEQLFAGLNYKMPSMNSRRYQDIEKKYGYSAVGCMQLGDYYAESGQWDKACSAYLMITKKEPDHPWGWLLLAELYSEAERNEEARGCYMELLRLVPEHRQAIEALRLIK